MINDLYTEFVEQLDADMLSEIEEQITNMGGEIVEVDLATRLIRISIDDELEDEAYELMKSIMDVYNNKRTDALKNPFFGVTLIKGDLDDI